jgi:hypothetical protein
MPGKSLSLRAAIICLRKTLRAALVAFVLLLSLVLGCLHSAQAKAGEALIDFGQELSKLASLRVNDHARVLSVNDVQLHLVSASSWLDLHEVMARFHGFCRDGSGIAIPEAIQKRLSTKAQHEELSALDGVYRHETKDAGVVACLDTGSQLSLDDMTARLQRFAKTGDLASIGRLRYVLARRSAENTTVLVMWTEGKASILEMFPKQGDAPGVDPVNLPRPPGIRRLLSAVELGLPYQVTLYESESQTPPVLREWYSRRLGVIGWTFVATTAPNTLIAKIGSRTLYLHMNVTAKHRTSLSIAELS